MSTHQNHTQNNTLEIKKKHFKFLEDTFIILILFHANSNTDDLQHVISSFNADRIMIVEKSSLLCHLTCSIRVLVDFPFIVVEIPRNLPLLASPGVRESPSFSKQTNFLTNLPNLLPILVDIVLRHQGDNLTLEFAKSGVGLVLNEHVNAKMKELPDSPESNFPIVSIQDVHGVSQSEPLFFQIENLNM